MLRKGPAFGEFTRLLPAFVVYGCFATVVSLSLLSHFILVWSFPHSKQLLWVFIGTILGATIAFRSRREHWVYRTLDALPPRSGAATWWFLGVLGMAAISCLDLNLRHLTDILDHHGSLFDWIVGSLTVVGIWLTYNTITESQRIIRSFPQLQSSLVALAKETAAHPDSGKLRFLAYTASIGFLALSDEQWSKLNGAFTELGNRFEVICLDDLDLTQWHNQYIGRTTSRNPEGGATELGLKETLDATENSKQFKRLRQECCKKLKSEMMPGYYLIFNEQRAIIVSPFFVPNHALAVNDPATAKLTKDVQMFGFETTDQRIIEDAKSLFGHYWNDEHQRLCHFDSQADCLDGLAARMKKEFDQWVSQARALSAEQGKIYRYRILVVEEKPWDAIKTFLRPKVGEKDFQAYLLGSKASAENGKLVVSVEREDQKHWIDLNCGQHIEEAKAGLYLDVPIEIAVRPLSLLID